MLMLRNGTALKLTSIQFANGLKSLNENGLFVNEFIFTGERLGWHDSPAAQ